MHVPNQFRIKTGQLGSTDDFGNNGAFGLKYNSYKIFCIASNKLGWEHVSVTINRQRCPEWNIMAYIKNLFWDDEDTVIQFHPARSEYINSHPFCLHLWKPIGLKLPLPEQVLV